MSNEQPVIQKVNTEAPLTMVDLMKMFLEQSKQQADAYKEMADAIRESRKPYVDPRVLADLEQRRKDRKELVDMEMRKRNNAKRNCPHTNEGGKLNIKWMQHSNGIILGVCGTCQSPFDATHSREDAQFLRQDQKAIRNMGRAGEHARRGADIAV